MAEFSHFLTPTWKPRGCCRKESQVPGLGLLSIICMTSGRHLTFSASCFRPGFLSWVSAPQAQWESHLWHVSFLPPRGLPVLLILFWKCLALSCKLHTPPNHCWVDNEWIKEEKFKVEVLLILCYHPWLPMAWTWNNVHWRTVRNERLYRCKPRYLSLFLEERWWTFKPWMKILRISSVISHLCTCTQARMRARAHTHTHSAMVPWAMWGSGEPTPHAQLKVLI